MLELQVDFNTIYTHTHTHTLTMTPAADISDNQYGFRDGRGTGMACSLLNDVITHCKYQKSTLFVASLDAEKCFDSICHISLFVKLIDVIPVYEWLVLHEWYSQLNAMVKWNGKYSKLFNVTRGTRQGSVLSPYLLNVFINQLLVTLQNVDTGIVIGDSIYNSFAYADDVSLFGTSIPGLQHLITICVQNSARWRFNFNQEKSKCMIVGKSPFIYEPHWYMDSNELCCVDQLEMLGNIFNSKGSGADHVNKRIAKCRQSFYGLSPAGMLYPGASTDVQSYLFKNICQPTLTYGADCINITDNDILKLDSAQCKLIKQSLGLSKRSHNT